MKYENKIVLFVLNNTKFINITNAYVGFFVYKLSENLNEFYRI